MRRRVSLSYVIGAVALALLAAGCGGPSAETSSATSVPPPSPAVSTSTTTSSSAASTTPTTIGTMTSVASHFTYTNATGWMYSGTLNLSAEITASTSIASSPPNEAEFQLSQTIKSAPTKQFSDTNTGRPSGPTLYVMSGWIVWGTGAAAGDQALQQIGADMRSTHTTTNLADMGSIGPTGPCQLVPPTYAGSVRGATAGHELSLPQSSWSTYGFALYCDVTAGSATDQWSIPEKDVSAAVATVPALKPYLVLSLQAIQAGHLAETTGRCELLITPSGTANEDEWTAQVCGAIDIAPG